jgi:hypothetical protein
MRQAMVLITYTPGPAGRTPQYEQWLRTEDNPFFNTIAGIGEYSNWKIIAPRDDALHWTYFDFLVLASPDDLQRVWFSARLDEFRRNWIARWGYGAGTRTPPVVNAYGHLFEGEGEPLRARERFVELVLDAGDPAQTRSNWRLTASVRKHYAIGPAQPPEAWRLPADQFNALGHSRLRVQLHAVPPEQRTWSRTRLLAECIAAPSLGR